MKKILLTALLFVSFVGEAAHASENGRVYMESEFLDDDLIRIDVIAEEIKVPVVGIAFHLNYEQEKLHFLKYLPGDFLERGGNPFYMVKDKDGRLIFGETLRNDDAFPLGEGKIAEFYFQLRGKKDLKFLFERGVLSSMDAVRQDIDKVDFENLYIQEHKPKSGILDSLKVNSGKFGDITAGHLSLALGSFLGVFMYFLLKRIRYKSA